MWRAQVRWAWCSVVLLAAACSSDGGASSAAAVDTTPSGASTIVVDTSECAQDASPGTVTLWHSLSGSVTLDALDHLAQGLHDATGSTLVFRRFESDAELLQAFATTAMGEQPDLVLVTEQVTRALLDSERFRFPDECMPGVAEDIYPQVAAPYSFEGRMAAVPFGVSLPVLVYDAQRFRAAGLDPDDPPRTFEELLTAAATIRQSGVSTHGMVVSDSCAATLVQQYSAQRGVELGSGGNGHDERLMSVELSSPETIADLSALRDAAWNEDVKYIGGNTSGFDDLVTITMPNESAVMSVHTSGAIGEIIALLGGGNFENLELGVAPLPGPGVGSLVGGNALWVPRTDVAERASRAWQALEWLTAPSQIASLDAATGYSPSSKATATDPALLAAWKEHPQMRVPYEQLLATPVSAATTSVMMGPYEDVAGVFFTLCDRILDHGAEVETALGEATTSINQLIAEYEAQVAGTEPPATTVASTPTQLATVQGRIRCESGAEVVGIWVDVRHGGSGWAAASAGPRGWTEFTIDIDPTSDYQLHVGCGGTAETWGTAYFSDYVEGNYLAFECADASGHYHGRCAVVSV